MGVDSGLSPSLGVKPLCKPVLHIKTKDGYFQCIWKIDYDNIYILLQYITQL